MSLREHLTALIEAHSQMDRMVTLFVGVFGAFAWAQIQRRLEILNHENARLLQQQEMTVSADTYRANEDQRRQDRAALEDWRKIVDADRAKTVSRDEFQRDVRTEHRASSSFGWQWIAGVIGILLFVLAIANFWSLHH